MIIWQGFGILIPIVALLVMLLVQFGLEAIVPSAIMDEYKKWFALLNFLMIAAALHGLAVLLKKIGKPKIVIDKESGKEIELRRSDSLFFVPARFWPYIVLAFGILIMFGL
jgi:hypothetical protein